ncbi:MAG: hypothetical protein ACK52I_34850 [Pseudomonadota bacterium]|jgi:hypothetical protein
MQKFEVEGTLVTTLTSKQDWVNRVPRVLEPYRNMGGDAFLFIDAKNRVCTLGHDFMIAEKEGTFPVKVVRVRRPAHKEEAQP